MKIRTFGRGSAMIVKRGHMGLKNADTRRALGKTMRWIEI
jgi:hypothetical protein